MKYVHRSVEGHLLKAAASFPVVVLTGPRQTGKSTLCRRLFHEYEYITLDDPVRRSLAQRDPALFLESLSENTIIDEIQYAPDILPYIKIAIDQDRRRSGHFILTGSHAFQVMKGVSESLAGRAAIFELLGMSLRELSVDTARSLDEVYTRIMLGGYPDPLVHGVDRQLFYSSYVATYLERDLRQILDVQELSRFQVFLELLAARCGSVLNRAELSRTAGVSARTVERWLSVLETSRLIYQLRPYSKNISKRVVKSPKIYFSDTGLASYLLQYPDSRSLAAGSHNGAMLENFLVMELEKYRVNNRAPFNLYFYRDSHGNELDLVCESHAGIDVAEIKMARTIRDRHIQSVSRQLQLFPNTRGFIVSLYEEEMMVTPEIKLLPWNRIAEIVAQS